MRSAAARVVAVPATVISVRMPSPVWPGLARHLVGAGAEVDGEVAAGAGADVLDLAHDLVALAVDVDLGDVAALVGDGEGRGAAGQVGPGDLARRVGGGDGDAVLALVLGRAAGEGREEDDATEGEGRDLRVHVRGLVVRAGAGGPASGQEAMTVAGRSAGSFAGSAGGRARARRRGRRPRATEEEEHRGHQVGEPHDDLEHGRVGREVEDALEQRAVPARGGVPGADVEGGVVRGRAGCRPPGGRGSRRRARRRRRRSAGRR